MRENRTYGSEGGEASAFPTLSQTPESGVGVGCWCWIEAGLLDLAAQRFNQNP